MSGKSIISNAYLEDIGDAIRQKKGTEDTYYPSQMGDAIRSIEGIIPSGTLEIDANGTYDVTQYAEATVDIPEELYSVGTEVITRYIGRDSNARGNFYVGRINTSTGEMWYETDDDYPSMGTTYAVSKVYIPVDSSYSFARGLGFLYFVFYYDENKDFISYAVPQPNTIYWIDFPPLPANAKYMRLAIHSSMSYRNTIVVRTA